MIDFNEYDTFTQEDNAEFSLGSNDVTAHWFSMLPTEDGNTVSGLFVQIGRAEFDDAVEAVNQDRKKPIEQVTIVHDATGASDGSNVKTYWHFTDINLFVVAKGLKDPFEQLGIVYLWKYIQKANTPPEMVNGKPKPNTSYLKFRAFLQELLPVYTAPVQISVNSSKAGAFLKVLKSQQRVLQAFKENAAKQGKQGIALPIWAFSIPVKRSKLIAVGKTIQKSMILPESAIPEVIDEEYFKTHSVFKTDMGPEFRIAIEALLPETIEWAVATTATLLQDKDERAASQPSQSVPDGMSTDDYMTQDDARFDASPVSMDGGATTGQRKALEAIAKKLGDDTLMALAKHATLSFDEASQAITDGNKAAAAKRR